MNSTVSDEALWNAMRAVKEQSVPIRAAARMHSVPRATLRRALKSPGVLASVSTPEGGPTGLQKSVAPIRPLKEFSAMRKSRGRPPVLPAALEQLWWWCSQPAYNCFSGPGLQWIHNCGGCSGANSEQCGAVGTTGCHPWCAGTFPCSAYFYLQHGGLHTRLDGSLWRFPLWWCLMCLTFCSQCAHIVSFFLYFVQILWDIYIFVSKNWTIIKYFIPFPYVLLIASK